MQWTMPHRVLQIVASLLALAAASSFVLGVVSTPQRGGRLPGQKAPGAAASAGAIDAVDATPLADERIEGPPPPSPEEIAKAEAAKAARAEAEAAKADELDEGANAAPAGNAPFGDFQLRPAPPAANAQTSGAPAEADEPPH